MRYGAGLSLALWHDLLPRATIYMAELDDACVRAKKAEISSRFPRSKILMGNAGDSATLKRWLKETGGGLDFIIDDGSHHAHDQWASLTTLWHGLAPGGKFVLEDIGETRLPQYADGWPLADPPSLIVAIQGLMGDVVEFGGGTSSRSLEKTGVPPQYPLLHKRRVLPGLKSVQCFAEACILIKCGGARSEGRCP
mmetsp:Transcript_40816/g.132192  ORF Transcript_40816/g.132192 Transcript_40816/m.132192 type:complete len:195 (-) Transcript_40816:217-801(-)